MLLVLAQGEYVEVVKILSPILKGLFGSLSLEGRGGEGKT